MRVHVRRRSKIHRFLVEYAWHNYEEELDLSNPAVIIEKFIKDGRDLGREFLMIAYGWFSARAGGRYPFIHGNAETAVLDMFIKDIHEKITAERKSSSVRATKCAKRPARRNGK